MKPIVISFLLLFFTPFALSLSNGLAFAETYPNSCPSEARSILNAVGGCSAVNRSSYPSVYEKCCVKSASVSPAPTPPPTTPKPTPVKSPSPSITPSQQLTPIKYTEPFRNFSKPASATQTQESIEIPPSENKPIKIIREGFRKTFDRLLRFFRFR